MKLQGILAAATALSILLIAGGCYTLQPDPVPDQATEPLTVYWPPQNVALPEQPQP